MDEPIIRVRGITKRFGPHPVVDDLSFDVAAGEIVGLLGPNGSGKTTTIRLLNGVLMPDTGTIAVGRHDPQHEGDAVRKMSGVLTESAAFYRHMTALDNLRFFADLYDVNDGQRPDYLLDVFGLEEYKNHKVGAYSTGMRKRLGLAKAMLHDPKVLFLDEPTNGLDPEGTRMVLHYIKELNRSEGTTVILCSHLLQQLEAVCHRYLFILAGRLIEQGTLRQLEEKYRDDVVLRVETDLNLEDAAYDGIQAEPDGAGFVRFHLPGKAAVPGLLRRLLQDADVYGAHLVERDLESLYFRVRERVEP